MSSLVGGDDQAPGQPLHRPLPRCQHGPGPGHSLKGETNTLRLSFILNPAEIFGSPCLRKLYSYIGVVATENDL